jgi:hypothetical protein
MFPLPLYLGFPPSVLASSTKHSKDTDPAAALTAGAEKEIAYLTKFGRPLHPFQRLRREIYNYQKQSHIEHLDNLEINGLIDWQHCAILSLFLQCGIPKSLQNYGDSVSESLQTPKLPHDFDSLSERDQFNKVELLRRRQLHYFYVTTTAELNRMHYDAMAYKLSTLRRKFFHHASDPWEGDNVTLKKDLIQVTKAWPEILGSKSSTSGDVTAPCPITFSEDEACDCLRLDSAQLEADEQLEACRRVIGVGLEGWLPSDQYEELKHREGKLKVDALDAAESDEERARICEHWPFDDFPEDDYF